MHRILVAIVFCLCVSVSTEAAVPIAVFPLEDLAAGRSDVNLPITRVLSDYLRQNGNEIIAENAVITFMANHRIRKVGQLEAFNVLQVLEELRAGFVLTGTVQQRKERPDPTFALTLALIRASDARTVWSYAGSVTTAERRKALGIGEPFSTDELQYLLLDEMFASWPWQSINEMQEVGAVHLDTVRLQPKYARPGDEMSCRVSVHDSWAGNLFPKAFFKANDQIYPATVSDDGKSFAANWVAGDENGSYPVSLLLEWAQYERIETVLLGSYIIDGTPPLLEVDLRGGKMYQDMQVFNRNVVVVPSMVVPKPLARWRLSINYWVAVDDKQYIGEMKGKGNLPSSFVWEGRGYYGDGIYEFVVEAWDHAGNKGLASATAEYSKALPKVDLALSKKQDQMIMDVQYASKVPLRYWRLEMWTNEGRLLTEAEGSELPVKVGFKPPEATDQEITGFVFLQDAFGKQSRVKVEELLPELKKKRQQKEDEATGISENWVDEF